MKGVFVLIFCVGMQTVNAQFFTQYWATFDSTISNTKLEGERLRAQDATISIHPVFSISHPESQMNGLQLISVNEVIMDIKRTEIVFEMWGGHPLSENKRFTINGRGTYHLPEKGNSLEQSEYIYPSIPITTSDLVNGVNAFQLAVDRGVTFWGNYIVDEMAVKCYLKDDDKRILNGGLKNFKAIPAVEKMEDLITVKLSVAPEFQNQISSVSYIARYDGYDDRGDGYGNNWHGFTHKKIYTNHVGTATQAPFSVNWDTRMIPTQGKAIAIKAIIELKNGLLFETEILDNLWFKKGRPMVLLLHTTDAPAPFWSRDKQFRTAKITLPVEPNQIENAELFVKIWDGGEGDIKDPFKLNGIAYAITGKHSDHDIHLTKHLVDAKNLKAGENTIELLSDTPNHGIEMLLPFPALIIRLKNK